MRWKRERGVGRASRRVKSLLDQEVEEKRLTWLPRRRMKRPPVRGAKGKECGVSSAREAGKRSRMDASNKTESGGERTCDRNHIRFDSRLGGPRSKEENSEDEDVDTKTPRLSEHPHRFSSVVLVRGGRVGPVDLKGDGDWRGKEESERKKMIGLPFRRKDKAGTKTKRDPSLPSSRE